MPHGNDRDARPAAHASLSQTCIKQMVQIKNRVSGLLMETESSSYVRLTPVLKYSVGVVPSVFLNMEMNELGVL